MRDFAPVLIAGLLLFLVIRIVIAIIRQGVKTGIQSADTGPRIALPIRHLPASDTRPGRYRVSGVDKETRLDTTTHVYADSEANARVKAELDGIIPTVAERVGDK